LLNKNNYLNYIKSKQMNWNELFDLYDAIEKFIQQIHPQMDPDFWD
jgi:hypothetical protein